MPYAGIVEEIRQERLDPMRLHHGQADHVVEAAREHADVVRAVEHQIARPRNTTARLGPNTVNGAE